MHLSLPFLSLLAAAPLVQCCIRVHTKANYDPLATGGDGITVEIWDDDFFRESQHQQKHGANSETHWTFNFGGGHHVELWNSGKSGRVWLDNGWKADLHLKATSFEDECVLDVGNGCKLHATHYTSCLNDNFGNCGNWGCGL